MTHTVVDKAGRTHTVEPGAWWWFDGYDGPEVLRVDPDGTEHAHTVGWDCPLAFSDVVLLCPVVPYTSAPPRTRRDVALAPVPGDVLDTPLYRLHVDRVDDGRVHATTTWYDGTSYADVRGLADWRRHFGGPKGSRPRVTPVAYPSVPGAG